MDSEEEGFFLDMAKPPPEDPSMGEELLISEVLELLNDPEFEKLVAVLQVLQRSGTEISWIYTKEYIEAYAALSDETRKTIESGGE